MEPSIAARKRDHLDACLTGRVTYRTRRPGFAAIDLPYRALPDTDLAEIDTRCTFMGRPLAAPLLVGAMTGGSSRAGRINHNLAVAAERVGVGLMLGSQRVMLERPEAELDFSVRRWAPTVPIVGNLGVAQLNLGYGAAEVRTAIERIQADGLALHANPLQEAMQEGGDGDFRGLSQRVREVARAVPYPVMLKEVGHGLSAATVEPLGDAGLYAFDVAGAGGTSWARVEALVRWGEPPAPDLVEWGIPTVQALREVRAVAPRAALLASGGVRSGLDVAKSIALGARWCAMALPLLRPALASPDAVEGVLRRVVWELRVAMHGAGAANLAELARVPWRARVGDGVTGPPPAEP